MNKNLKKKTMAIETKKKQHSVCEVTEIVLSRGQAVELCCRSGFQKP